MNTRDVCKALNMDETLPERLPELSVEDCGRLRFLLRTAPDAFLQALKEMPDPEGTSLRFSLMMAAELREQYAALGISEQIWKDTMSDIRIWSDKLLRDTGIIGLREMGWLTNHLTLGLFRLGRLQFQPSRLGCEVTVNGRTLPADTPTFEVHIAEGEPLRHDAVLRSYEQAKVFFKEPHPVFVCGSWLLSPALKELLQEPSGILDFQRDFTLFEEYPESRQAEERIFGAPLDNPADYPENTTLQRNAKAWLLSGKKIPAARGIILCE